MAFPVVGKNVGSGIDQLKAQIVGWVRDEIRASQRGGIGVPLTGGVGKLGNDALTNPAGPQGIYDASYNFALSSFATTIRTITITVPAGRTSATVLAISRLYAVNPTTSDDRIVTWTSIAGVAANNLPSTLAPASGGSTISISPMMKVLSGLTSGSTFTITVEGGSWIANWAANAANTLEVTGMIFWAS